MKTGPVTRLVTSESRLTETTDTLTDLLQDVVSEAQLLETLTPIILQATCQRHQEVLRQVQLPLVTNTAVVSVLGPSIKYVMLGGGCVCPGKQYEALHSVGGVLAIVTFIIKSFLLVYLLILV